MAKSAGPVLLFVLACTLGFYIASIVIGFQEADDDCQRHDKTGLTLATWLQVTGIVGLCVNIVISCCLYVAISQESQIAFLSFAGLTLLNVCFTLAWFVVGIVLIARSDGACVVDSTSLGVMSMIMIVLQGLGLCCSGSNTSVEPA